MDDEQSTELLIEEIRQRSPLPVFAALLVGVVMVGIGVNLFSGALYSMITRLVTGDIAQMGGLLGFVLDMLTVAGTFLVLAVLTVYLFWLLQRQRPVVRRVITLLLPFERDKRGKVRLVPIPKLHVYEGKVHDNVLNWAVEKDKDKDRPKWHESWDLPWPKDRPVVTGDGVTLLYDLVEWMVVQEVADFGRHVNDGKDNLRPGDDFDDMPAEPADPPRSQLFDGERANYFWLKGNKPGEQVLKLPVETKVGWQPLAKAHGVEKYGKEPVRALVIRNPAGRLVVQPSQIWRRATSQQARSMLKKLLADHPDMYPLEMRLLTEVQLRQMPFVLPFAHKHTAAYQRWLLELQEQLLRHMDWDRYVEADYKRMLVAIRDATVGQAGPDESAGT